MTGRGAGDMKGGFAMGVLAVAALRRAMPGALSGELSFLSVIEEECTGNGTLAACHAGVLGDAAVLLEPTGLGLLLGGVGVLWAEIEIAGVPAHAEAADRAVNPVRFLPLILQALAAPRGGVQRRCRRPGLPRDRPALQHQRRRGHRRGLGVERACPGPPAGTRRLPARLDGGRGLRPGRGRGAAGRVRRRLAGRSPPAAAPDRLPRRGLPARQRPPAGERDGGRARQRPRRPARAGGDRRHHRRQVLPQPVRRARPGLRPARRATSTPPTRRSSWPASCAGPRPWPGSSPASSPPAACRASCWARRRADDRRR